MKTRDLTLARGSAAVEFVVCLPLLVLLLIPVFDLARVLQANMMLTSIAREGAQLVSRTSEQEQAIMDSLAATALPLDMVPNGAIHVTKILARTVHGVTSNVVLAQHRWARSSYMPPPGVWTCGSGGTYWGADGQCKGLPPPTMAPPITVMQGQLQDGDVVYLVEVFYRFPLLYNGVELGGGLVLPTFTPNLYAMTVL